MYKFIKLILDKIFSVLFLFLLSPIFILTVLLIQIYSPGKIYYSHKRIGKNGKLFNLYKLRTMYQDSDKILNEYLNLNADAKDEWEKFYCLKNDPRVIKPFGSIARKYSIDEFPQFINVIKGDLSLIGPRPITESEIKYFPTSFINVRHTIKPGITGLWQINGRSDLSMNEKIHFDMAYINNLSFNMDLKILLITPIAVIKAKGAY
ncbi:MAG TPA: sugar transferase [Ignavibacteria bacterium]|nr:sugar transferase [Ignavibacteria bacterium]